METQRVVLRGHSAALDGIRAFAVLAVIATHAGVRGAQGGGLGVYVFFVLSGFLITTLLAQERDRTGGIRLGDFYLRRALRLFPALALVIVATTIAAYTVLGGPVGDATVRAIPAALFYFANWKSFFQGSGFEVLGYYGHFWSLSVEEQFYLAWPPALILLWRRFGERGVTWALAGICVIPLVIRIATIHGPDTAHLLYGTHAIADQLAWGALLALLLRGPRVTVDRLLGAAAWPAVAVLALLCAVLRPVDPETWGVFSNTLGPSIVAAAAAVAIGHIVTVPSSLMARLLAWRPLVYVGKISYGMYLWHILVLYIVREVVDCAVAIQLLSVAITFAVASGSYYLWERRFLKLKDRFEPVRPIGGRVLD